MFDWKMISQDPCSDAADVKWRIWYDKTCTRWELNVLSERDERIIELLKSFSSNSGLRVLDIGFVEHSVLRTSSSGWFHRKLREINTFDVYGVDLLSEDVQKIQEKYLYRNCYVGDVTDASAVPIDGGKFDVIHAGDIIEHLSDMSGFFGFLRKNLRESGGVVFTTPNPHSIFRLFRLAKFGGSAANYEHVSWITPTNMNELCRRYGFTFSCSVYSVKNKIKSLILKIGGKTAFKYRDLYFDEFVYIIEMR